MSASLIQNVNQREAVREGIGEPNTIHSIFFKAQNFSQNN